MTDDLHLAGNGGAAAVIMSALGKLDNAVSSMQQLQATHGELLTRFDERQRGWATKHEVSEVSHHFEAALAPVAAQATAAHVRLDAMQGSLAVLGGQLGSVETKVDQLIAATGVERAEIRGAWRVIKPSVAWSVGIVGTVVSAFVIGRFA